MKGKASNVLSTALGVLFYGSIIAGLVWVSGSDSEKSKASVEAEPICNSISIPYDSVEEETEELEVGDDETIEGEEGERYVCTLNGEVTRDEVIHEPVNEVVRHGTYEPPVHYNSGYRSGAICNDGTYSDATGSGACSWHGGVSEWLY